MRLTEHILSYNIDHIVAIAAAAAETTAQTLTNTHILRRHLGSHMILSKIVHYIIIIIIIIMEEIPICGTTPLSVGNKFCFRG